MGPRSLIMPGSIRSPPKIPTRGHLSPKTLWQLAFLLRSLRGIVRPGTTHQRSVRSRAAIRSNHSWGERVRFSPCRARASASSRPAQRSKMWRTSRYIHAWRGGWAAALTVVLRAVDSTTSAWVATLTPWWCLLSPTLSVSVTLNCIAERDHTGTRPLSLFVYPPPLCPGPFDSTVLLI